MSDGLDPRALTVAIEPVGATPELQALWHNLEARADASFFLSWDWIGCWLASSGIAPLLLTARLGREVVGLALLQPARLRRHLVFAPRTLLLHQAGDPELDAITIEYNGILADRRMVDAVTKASLAALVRDPRWDELHASGVTYGPEMHVQEMGLPVWTRARTPSWRVDLDAVRRSGRPYLAGLGSSTRSQIRRALRLYEQRGPLVATAAGTVAEAMSFFDGLKSLHQRYWQGRGRPGSFARPFFERFHRALITQALPGGGVELLRVTSGEAVIGYVYNFRHRGHVYNYQTGFAYEDDARLKPGLVSHYLAIERHLADGAQIYDFLAGDHRYKRNLGIAGPEMFDLVVQRPTPALRAERFLRRLKSALVPDER